jgi:hypothetical protein
VTRGCCTPPNGDGERHTAESFVAFLAASAILSAQHCADDRSHETHRHDQNHRERRVDVR